MHIVNVMFGRNLGGLEQAFLDYNTALSRRNHKVTAILDPRAKLHDVVASQDVSVMPVKTLGQWDIIASSKLSRWLRENMPDVIIAHGNRAISILSRASNGKVPLVPVAHNYKIRRFSRENFAFAVTEDMRQAAIAKGVPEHNAFCIPNMIEVPPSFVRPILRNPVVIGAMGRLIARKGFDVFIQALGILKQSGVPFKALLGGEGEQRSKLEALANAQGLGDSFEMIGWVHNTRAFYDAIDVFCLPSLHEPFGIVLLEAFAQKLPVVTSDAEGPSQIVKAGEHALVVPRRDPVLMARELGLLINDTGLASRLAANAHRLVKERYSIDVVGEQLEKNLLQIIGQQKTAPE